MNSKTAILGGSFDPVHLGHLFLLHSAVQNTDYDNFVLIPACLSNFKQSAKPLSSDRQRLEMLNLAIESYCRIYPNDRKVNIKVSDIEIKRGGVSYTSTTVKELLKEYNLNSIGLIIGDDHIEKLPAWYEFEYLKDHVQFIICPRSNSSETWSKLPQGIDYIKLEINSTSPESSTSIRLNVNKYENYLPKEVLDYVRKNNLYN